MSVLWRAEVTAEMTTHLNEEELAELTLALDEAVMSVCSDWEVN